MSEPLSNPDNSALVLKKRETYERLCEGKPDALFILAHDVEKNDATGELKSGSYSHTDPLGRIGGAKARSLAGAELQHFFPDALIVANSWSIQGGERVSHADVTAEELGKRGVNEKDILRQERSYSTFTEIIELIKLIVEKNWHHVAVIANEFQISRAEAMLDSVHRLHDSNGESDKPEVQEALEKFAHMKTLGVVKIKFVSAENVLTSFGPKYKRLIDRVKESPEWKRTMEMEKEGEERLRAGTYKGLSLGLEK